MSDPQRLELDKEIGLVDARIEELLAGLTARSRRAAWSEIQELVDVRRRLVLAITRRATLLGESVPIERVLVLCHGLGLSVRQHVSDPIAVRAIARDMERMGLRTAPGTVEVEVETERT